MVEDNKPMLFEGKVAQFRQDWYDFMHKIASEPTPPVDQAGQKIIRKRPDGYNYIVEQYMRDRLDYYFPGWSWEASAPLQFLSAEWVVAQGHLMVPDPYLAALGINPPVRKFFGCDSVRIQYKKAPATRTVENIIDVGDNCKQANTSALKFAINRMCHIGDDVYAKRIEFGEGDINPEEIADTIEAITKDLPF